MTAIQEQEKILQDKSKMLDEVRIASVYIYIYIIKLITYHLLGESTSWFDGGRKKFITWKNRNSWGTSYVDINYYNCVVRY